MIIQVVKASTVRIRCATCDKPTPLDGFYRSGFSGVHRRTCISCVRTADNDARRRRGAPRRHQRYNSRGEVWCNNCERYLPAFSFKRHPSRPHTYWSYCMVCTREIDRERRVRKQIADPDAALAEQDRRVRRRRLQRHREARERQEFVAKSILLLRRRGLTKAEISRLLDTTIQSVLAWERKERRVTPPVAERVVVVVRETRHLPVQDAPAYRRRDPHPEIEQLLARCLPRVRAIPVRTRWERGAAA